MAVQTLTLAGRKFVLLPKREYDRLRDRAAPGNGNHAMEGTGRIRKATAPSKQDLGDLAEIERLKRDTHQKPIPWKIARERLA